MFLMRFVDVDGEVYYIPISSFKDPEPTNKPSKFTGGGDADDEEDEWTW